MSLFRPWDISAVELASTADIKFNGRAREGNKVKLECSNTNGSENANHRLPASNSFKTPCPEAPSRVEGNPAISIENSQLPKRTVWRPAVEVLHKLEPRTDNETLSVAEDNNDNDSKEADLRILTELSRTYFAGTNASATSASRIPNSASTESKSHCASAQALEKNSRQDSIFTVLPTSRHPTETAPTPQTVTSEVVLAAPTCWSAAPLAVGSAPVAAPAVAAPAAAAAAAAAGVDTSCLSRWLAAPPPLAWSALQLLAEEQRRKHDTRRRRHRKFACPKCPMSFSNKGQLTGHFRKHTGERPFECSTCQKRFTRNEELTRHSRIHSGDRPFACVVCHKRFGRKDHLNKHMRTHTGALYSSYAQLAGATERLLQPHVLGLPPDPRRFLL